MNINRQLNKGNNMKKIIVSVLMSIVLSASMISASNAAKYEIQEIGTWTHTPTYGGGSKSTYQQSMGDILRQHGISTVLN